MATSETFMLFATRGVQKSLSAILTNDTYYPKHVFLFLLSTFQSSAVSKALFSNGNQLPISHCTLEPTAVSGTQ